MTMAGLGDDGGIDGHGGHVPHPIHANHEPYHSKHPSSHPSREHGSSRDDSRDDGSGDHSRDDGRDDGSGEHSRSDHSMGRSGIRSAGRSGMSSRSSDDIGRDDGSGHDDIGQDDGPRDDMVDHHPASSHEHTVIAGFKPLELASLPQHIASLSSALKQSNHNLEICHDTLLQSLTNESKLRKENEVIKKMRKKDNSYWRSRYVMLKQDKQTKDDDYNVQIAALKHKVNGLEKENGDLGRNNTNIEHKTEQLSEKNQCLEERMEHLEKQLQNSQSAQEREQHEREQEREHERERERERAREQELEQERSLAHISSLEDGKRSLEDEKRSLEDEKRSLERKVAKYKDLFAKTKEWHANEMGHMKAMHSLASNAESQTKDIREMQANIRTSVASMQSEMVQVVSDIMTRIKQQNAQHNMTEEVLRKLVADTEAKFLQEQHIRKALHNALIELRGNIRVFCRIRPYLDQQDASWANTTDPPLLPLTVEDPDRISVNLTDKSRAFDFDKVFDADAEQSIVFAQAAPLITSLLDGFNVAIMAYGQTGSGKTYTMQGSTSEPGIIPRALELLFEAMRENSDRIRYKAEFSMVEIYNEAIFDLLDEDDLDKDNKHELHQSQFGTEVNGLTTVCVQSLDEVTALMTKGHRLRAVAETRLNATSSRSHCIVVLTVEVHHKIHTTRTPAPTRSKLYLVDLAGSENVGMSGATGDNLREASYINRSLSSLGDVLGALAEGRGHVPYRNSRLTHMLQDALGGSAKMLLLVTVSPTTYSQRETMHALAFGTRARQVARGPAKKRNIVPSNGLVSSASTPNLSQSIKYDSRPSSPQGKNTTIQPKKKPSTLIVKPKTKAPSGHSPKAGSVPKFRM